MKSLPRLHKWEGGRWVKTRWAVGWLTGPDGDLVCVRPGRKTRGGAEAALSPVTRSRTGAVIAFVLKKLLLRVDENLKGLD